MIDLFATGDNVNHSNAFPEKCHSGTSTKSTMGQARTPSNDVITIQPASSGDDSFFDTEEVSLLPVPGTSSKSAVTSPPRPPPPPPPPQSPQQASSLDFEQIVNDYSIQATRNRLLEAASKDILHEGSSDSFVADWQAQSYNSCNDNQPRGNGSVTYRWKPKANVVGYTGRTATRWLLTITTGLTTGLVSLLIIYCTDNITTWRAMLIDAMWQTNKLRAATFWAYASISLSLTLLSALLCLKLAPEAVGSGIPEVKAYLNGVRVKRFSNARLLFVKILGTILSVSSGLAIGPEGPMVHIGAILGASCTKIPSFIWHVLPRSWLIRHASFWSHLSHALSHFAVDSERRDLVSIGAAAGLAAAFGTPIGGLLFSLEEASTFFNHRMFLKTLVAAAVATICIAVYHHDLSRYSIISLSQENDQIVRFEEVPLYLFVGLCGGLLGGTFCWSWEALQNIRRSWLGGKPLAHNVRWKLIEIAFVSVLSSTLTYFVPLGEWSCRIGELSDDINLETSIQRNTWTFHPYQFDCGVGRTNELATIFFGSRIKAITFILADPAQFDIRTLVMVGVIFFPLMTLTAGVALPSGLFMPTFLIGSSLGGAFGILIQDFFPQSSPSTFALLGAAALLAGVQRNLVSLCVIIVEGTGQVMMLIPVIISVVVAGYVANLITEGGYAERAMKVNKYPYLEHGVQKRFDIFRVGDVMSSPPVTVRPREQAQTLVKLLSETEHHGFPVVHPTTGRFMGLVRRDQIVALLQAGIFEGKHDDDSSNASTSSLLATPDTREWTPHLEIGRKNLMDRALHIKDDRYDHIETSTRNSVWITDHSIRNGSDDFDSFAWLTSVRHRWEAASEFQREHIELDSNDDAFLAGDDSMPAIQASNNGSLRLHDTNGTLPADFVDGMSPSRKKRDISCPAHYAVVATNDLGNVHIQRLSPTSRRKYVSLEAVMNRGTFCVPESCPLSKAYFLFTALGLRHLIVLGGSHGGMVVGIITRKNLLIDSISEHVGIAW
jgi:chloride channel 7